MGGYALVMAAVTAFGIPPEPLKPEYRQPPLRLCHLFANYRRISTDASFIGYTLTNAAIYGGLFAFLSGASFVLIDVLGGVQPEHFGFYFAAIVVGYIAGNLGSIRLARYLGGPDQILFYGLITALAGGAIMALLAYQQVYSPWAVMIPPQAIFMPVPVWYCPPSAWPAPWPTSPPPWPAPPPRFLVLSR